MAPRILPRQLDEAGSVMLGNKIKACGLDLKTGIYVDEITGDTRVRGVVTHKNEHIHCDAVVISAGVRSNIELAVEAGIEVNRGIVVNEKMQTSHADIYAVGDCAVFRDIISGLWEPAIQMGKVAGAHIAGDNPVYQHPVIGATMNAFNTSIFSIGDLGNEENAACIQVNHRNDIRGTYKNLFFKKEKLVGGLLVGDLKMTNPLLNGVKRGIDPEIAMDNKLL